jgi:hypothetical protein
MVSSVFAGHIHRRKRALVQVVDFTPIQYFGTRAHLAREDDLGQSLHTSDIVSRIYCRLFLLPNIYYTL